MNDLPIDPGTFEIWHQWRKVSHGAGCASGLAGALRAQGCRRPFLVTTPSLVRQGRLLETVRAAMGVAPVEVFSASVPHTPRSVVLEASARARAAGADCVVSFGGGTVIDTAKGIALALGAEITSEAGLDAFLVARQAGAPGKTLLKRDLIAHFALPTTLSGAEYSADIGITNTARQAKEIFNCEGAAPAAIFLDPELTGATPPRLWAATGLKTMSDAIEQTYANPSHPVIAALAERSIRWFSTYLPLCEADDEAVRADARLRCQLASWMSLFGIFNASSHVGLGGAMRHQLGGMFGIPHGEITCVLLPHIIRFNAQAVPDGFAILARSLDLPVVEDRTERVESIANAITALVERLDLPTRLGPLGVSGEGLDLLAANVMGEKSMRYNPRTVKDPREIVELVWQAI